jgi:transposase-like protein
MQCPKCDSQYVVKNGHTHTGKQNFKCRDCGRQFVMNPRHQPISKSTRELIDKLLLEKISLAGIVSAGERVTFAMSIYTPLFLCLPIKSFK